MRPMTVWAYCRPWKGTEIRGKPLGYKLTEQEAIEAAKGLYPDFVENQVRKCKALFIDGQYWILKDKNPQTIIPRQV